MCGCSDLSSCLAWPASPFTTFSRHIQRACIQPCKSNSFSVSRGNGNGNVTGPAPTVMSRVFPTRQKESDDALQRVQSSTQIHRESAAHGLLTVPFNVNGRPRPTTETKYERGQDRGPITIVAEACDWRRLKLCRPFIKPHCGMGRRSGSISPAPYWIRLPWAWKGLCRTVFLARGKWGSSGKGGTVHSARDRSRCGLVGAEDGN